MLCAADASVVTLIERQTGLTPPLEPGVSLRSVVVEAEHDKFDLFWSTVQLENAAFDWPLNVTFTDAVHTLRFAATVCGANTLVVASRDSSDLARVAESRADIRPERHSSSTYDLVRRIVDQLRHTAERDHGLFDQLSAMNNELVTLQRELAKRNFELERTKRDLEANYAELAAMYESFPVGIFKTDKAGAVLQSNERFRELIKRAGNLDAGWLASVHLDDAARTRSAWERAIGSGACFSSTQRHLRAGQVLWLEVNAAPVVDSEGALLGFVGTITDATARVRNEEALRANQRLEALSNVTGGVAHNFNNLLMVLLGGAESFAAAANDPQLEPIAKLNLAATEQAAALVRKLMAYAGQLPLWPGEFDANRAVERVAARLSRDFGHKWRINVQAAPEGAPTFAAEGEFEEVVAELISNARDAMPDGGEILIRTSTRDQAGTRVSAVSVRDFGTGMSDAIRARATEPFFTTKEVGKGVGLGLSFAHGYARSSGGSLSIDTLTSAGTTAKLMLPSRKKMR